MVLGGSEERAKEMVAGSMKSGGKLEVSPKEEVIGEMAKVRRGTVMVHCITLSKLLNR